MYDIFSISQDIAKEEIKIRESAYDFYDTQKYIITEVNKIETLQSSEYTADSQKQIQVLMKNIGDANLVDITDLNPWKFKMNVFNIFIYSKRLNIYKN